MIEFLGNILHVILTVLGIFSLCVVIGAGLALGAFWVRSKIPYNVNLKLKPRQVNVHFGDKKKEKK